MKSGNRAKLFTFMLMLVLMPVFGGVIPVHAQTDNDTPIYFLMDGDIWSYSPATGAVNQYSTWGYNEAPILSPDGSRFAYLSLASVAVNAINRNDYIGFDPVPNNVWVSGVGANVDDAVRLADQPANAVVSGGERQNVIGRRSLEWSPDSTRLVWIELNTDYHLQMVIYDLNSGQQRVLTTQLPLPYADAGRMGIHRVRWGDAGIAVENFGVNPNSNGQEGVPFFLQTLSLYDPQSGALISETEIGSDQNQVMDIFWLNSGLIGLPYQNGERRLLNPLTGAITNTQEQFEIFSLTTPFDTAAHFYLGKAMPDGTFNRDIFWDNGQPQNYQTYGIAGREAVSPSGNSVAYVSDALYVWTDGNLTRVPGTENVSQNYIGGVIWGRNGWRLTSAGMPDQFCPNVPAPRLQIGGRGSVIPGLGDNVLRDLPGKSAAGSTEIGVIPGGAVFDVLAGPVCTSELNWWLVNYNGQIGWTAEGEGSTYWLEPR